MGYLLFAILAGSPKRILVPYNINYMCVHSGPTFSRNRYFLLKKTILFIVLEGVPFLKRAGVRAEAQGSQRFSEALLSTLQALTLKVELMVLPLCAAARRTRGERSLW